MVMAPGPAMRGIARGKVARDNSASSSSAFSAVFLSFFLSFFKNHLIRDNHQEYSADDPKRADVDAHQLKNLTSKKPKKPVIS